MNSGAWTTAPLSSLAGFVPPAYVPARAQQDVCTVQLIHRYCTDCLFGSDCPVFEPGGADEDCGACLADSVIGDAQYGPLVNDGKILGTNLSGCVELLGDADCAQELQARASCEQRACADCRPATDLASGTAYWDCMTQARVGECQYLTPAADCITSPYVDPCGSNASTVEEAVVLVGTVFCGGG